MYYAGSITNMWSLNVFHQRLPFAFLKKGLANFTSSSVTGVSSI